MWHRHFCLCRLLLQRVTRFTNELAALECLILYEN
jgi:hypothetical protein